MKRFIYNGVILTVTSLVVRIIGMFFNVYVTNTVGSEAIGLFHIIMSVYLLGITFATSGISLSCIKIISEETTKNNYNKIESITKQCLGFSVIISIITSSIIIYFKEYITKTWLFNNVSSQVLIYIGIALPFIAMSAVIDGYFFAVKRVTKSAIADVFEVVVKIISTIILFRIFGVKSISQSCLILIIGDCISEIFAFIFIYILYIFDKKIYFSTKKVSYANRIISISLPLAISSYIRSGLSTLKQILIPIMLQKSGIAIQIAMSVYGTINGMVFPIILFPNFIIISFSSLLVPEFTELNVKKDYLHISETIKKLLSKVLIFGFYVIGIFIFMAQDISYILYKTNDVTTYIQIFSPLVIFMYIDNIVDSILKGLDKQVIVMIINIIDLITSVLCILVIIPLFGIKGYIFVIFLSTMFNSIISFKQIKQYIKVDSKNKENIQKILLSTMLTYITFTIFNKEYLNLILKLLIYSIIYVTIYYVINKRKNMDVLVNS